MCRFRSAGPPPADNHKIIRMSRIRSAGPPPADNHKIIRMSRIRSAGPPPADNKIKPQRYQPSGFLNFQFLSSIFPLSAVALAEAD